MNAPHLVLLACVVVGLSCLVLAGMVIATKVVRARSERRTSTALAPHRPHLLAVAAGEDDGESKAALCALDEASWGRVRDAAVAFLGKVRGGPAQDLVEVLCHHGAVDEALAGLSSRSAVRRARSAYLLGLVRDAGHTQRLLAMLEDRSFEVRLVAARALGTVGAPEAAPHVLRALRDDGGRAGIPSSVAATALLGMGVGIGPALRSGLGSPDPAVRHVCAMVAGLGTFSSAAPQLRLLLVDDDDPAVRVTAAVALGQVGVAEDAAALARHTGPAHAAALRRTCATALGELGNTAGIPALESLLPDADRRLAQLGADALVHIGPAGRSCLQRNASLTGPRQRAARGALAMAALRDGAATTGTATTGAATTGTATTGVVAHR